MSDDVEVVNAGPRTISRAVEVHATAKELFDQLADPRRHTEVDGSGTVRQAIDGPSRLGPDEKFSVKMRMFGIPYRITSRVTRFEEDRVIEWQHPLGHRWRWEFQEVSPGVTRLVETWDYNDARSPGFLEAIRFSRMNIRGITRTLSALRDRYAGG